MGALGRIAVLGAGVMGTASALRLAREGHAVVLYDRAAAPMSGASRWNEGKIHLGFLYAGDRSLRSADRMLPGGLAFRPLVERLIGTGLRHVTEEPDLFLVHRDSVASVDETRVYYAALAARMRCQPAAGDYLVDVSSEDVQELSKQELARVTAADTVIAGFRVPERSLATRWVADRLVDALDAEPRVAQRMGCEVRAVRAPPGNGRYAVDTAGGADTGFDVVVNALWDGRLRLDGTFGLAPPPAWTHRYRVSLFVRTHDPVADLPSFVLCTGPFGDVKRYSDRDFYLSWYPEGLLATGEELEPPPVAPLDAASIEVRTRRIVDALAGYVPTVRHVVAGAAEVVLAGGWVFAAGQGLLSDPQSTLHRRDRVGITQLGRYFSVDTGKYSIAPWLAEQLTTAVRDSLA